MEESDGSVSDEYELVDDRAEWQGDDVSEDDEHGPFSCKVCLNLLRDNVECSNCHGLFCREHLRVDKTVDKSPCPCIACSFAEVPQSLSSFLPNIPVQRMADAVPSRCDGCGTAFSWGELAQHACDRQTVACEHANWGCSWRGQRQHRPKHVASSTCPGQLARAEQEIAESRAEIAALHVKLAAMRQAKEDAERRALAAETHGRELEAKMIEAEKSLRQKDVVNAKQTSATADKLKAKAGQGGGWNMATAAGEATSGGLARGKKSGGSSHAVSKASLAQSTRHQPAATRSTAPTSVGIQQQLLGGMFTPKGTASSNTQEGNVVGSSTASSPTASSTQQQQQVQLDMTGRQADGTVGLVVPASVGARAQPVGVDAASQAPVPATEACLKPYLERPHALLEKKIVVFWPR